MPVPLPPDHPGIDPEHPVVLFDGVCNLCGCSVQRVIRHDRAGRFRFAALGSSGAERLLLAADAPSPLPDSMIVVDGGRCFTGSDAALRTARRLPFPFPLLGVFAVVPRPVRDALYRLVARNRYRWFGKRESCMVPTPELRSRFIE